MSDLLAWVDGVQARADPGRAARSRTTCVPDVVHAHDWLVAHTATALKEALGMPLVATMHATEAGRHQGWLPDRPEPGDAHRRVVADVRGAPGASPARSTCAGR